MENEQFRGYADHMGTSAFHQAVDLLVRKDVEAEIPPTVILCAEAVPWRCHRNLLADELLRREIEVTHILGTGAIRAHTLSSVGRFMKDRVLYPPSQAGLFR